MIEIYVEGQAIDLDKGWSTLLTFSIDDLAHPGDRRTAWSKTVVLPGTNRNNRLFGHIFCPEGANDYDPSEPNIFTNFNPTKAAQCLVFDDSMQVLKGVLSIMRVINFPGGDREYEVQICGELTGLALSLAGKRLEDLDFTVGASDYDCLYRIENVIASWDNIGTGRGLVYPLIDYGGYSVEKKDWAFRTFRPAIHAYDYVQRIFKEAGFTIDCPIFESARFKTLLVPFGRKDLTRDASRHLDLSTDTTIAALSNPSNIGPTAIDFGAGYTGVRFIETTPGVYAWQGGATNLDLFIHIEGERSNITPMQIVVRKSGNIVDTVIALPPGSGSFSVDYFNATPLSLAFPDTLSIRAEFTTVPIEDDPEHMNITAASIRVLSSKPGREPYEIGDEFELQDIVPQNVLQKDFLSSILKLWNMYLVEDKFDSRKLSITPYVDFYSEASQNAVDWTLKVDRSKPITITPLSEMAAKSYQYRYKQDSDYYNDLYQKRYNEPYGARTFTADYDFSDEKQTVEIIFAPTILVGYEGCDKIYSTILKQTGTGDAIKEEQVDSVIRLLQCKLITGVEPWNIDGGSAGLGLTSYPYAGHLDDPYTPSNDLNFGAPRELFFRFDAGTLNVNQGNVYISSFLAEITDKDSKLLECSMYLNARDIAELDFSKYVYVDGSIYKLKEIKDYNASSPDTCKVLLLKTINTYS